MTSMLSRTVITGNALIIFLVGKLHKIREISMEDRSTKIKQEMRSALFHEAWKMPHRPTEHDHLLAPCHSKNMCNQQESCT